MTDGIKWQKSSFSGPDDNQSCVELAPVAGAIKMRESDAPDVIVTTTVEKLRAFILGVKAGEFDHLI
ncbi:MULTISPECIES: DUF397 domain-containing protein [unclassified Streptomyces]|uniref:DUF397 domain-containing protein n=1 Tax=unclassified Streptomyces TaxID=2593676 RepID=UPI000DC75EEE|nr:MULTISPECIES: DUF397 domain-containing protein [unclassified Streptomyces]AWZ04939.1 DUF397 domain-containing protein [Streptomyces sp. ICC4]AWZ13387.1 DUF397 domain-containing protein [Streptomyces sp. ICC1]